MFKLFDFVLPSVCQLDPNLMYLGRRVLSQVPEILEFLWLSVIRAKMTSKANFYLPHIVLDAKGNYESNSPCRIYTKKLCSISWIGTESRYTLQAGLKFEITAS